MDHPFRMCGRRVEVYRFSARCTDPFNGGRFTACFPTREEAEAAGEAVRELDSSAYEWIDGIQVPDTPDTWAEAVRIFEAGKDAWEHPEPSAQDRIEAQVTYTAMMTDTLLEV